MGCLMEPGSADRRSETERRLDDLAEVVSGNACAHNNLAAAHNELAEDLRRKEFEATVAKRQGALSKIVAGVYDKAAAYTNHHRGVRELLRSLVLDETRSLEPTRDLSHSVDDGVGNGVHRL